MNRLEEILFDSNEKIVSVLGINTIQKFCQQEFWETDLLFCQKKGFISEENACTKKPEVFTKNMKKKLLTLKMLRAPALNTSSLFRCL